MNKKEFLKFLDKFGTASTYAEQDIKDKWEFYKEKYQKKMKK